MGNLNSGEKWNTRNNSFFSNSPLDKELIKKFIRTNF